MKKLIAFMLLLPMTVNASISCSIRDFALSYIPHGIAVGLECTNEEVIKKDVASSLDYLGICEDQTLTFADEKGMWGELCKYYLPGLVDMAVDSSIPSEWVCKATKLKTILKDIAVKQCDRL